MGTLRYRPEIGWLLQIAILIFVVTVLIGIANGTKAFGILERNVLLTHVHAGTLGWITLGVAAACLWIFGGTGLRAANEGFARGLVIALAGSIPLYVVGFWSGNFVARAVLSTPVFVSIVVLLGWAIREGRRIGIGRLTTPQLSAIAGLASLVIGSSLGVYAQFAFATGQQFDPMNIIGGHVTAQVVGFLLLLGMGLIEYWHSPDPTPATWAGRIQVGLLFFAALGIALGLALGQPQAAGGAVRLDVPALVIFLIRGGGLHRRTPRQHHLLRAPHRTGHGYRDPSGARDFYIAVVDQPVDQESPDHGIEERLYRGILYTFHYVAHRARRLFLFGEVQSPCARSSVVAPGATGSKREARSPSTAARATPGIRSSSTRCCSSPTAFVSAPGPRS